MEREGGAARPELCVGAIVVVSERLLLVQRARPPGEGQWSIPGGRVESGETMAAAVEREVLEETGLSVVTGELVGWAERLGRGYHFVIFDFRAEPAYQGELPDAVEMRAGLPEVTPGDDARAVAWVAGDELESLELVDGLAGFFTDNGVVVGGHLV
jgi:ADP-ribose pyrophosphatase YjhB (NUDIX family)